MSDVFIILGSGRRFDYLDPQPESIHVEDIAAGLSRICRFNGQLRRASCPGIYSVAQHSVLVSQAVPQEFALFGLLHDAHEAYMPDMPSPLKGLLPDFRDLELYVAGAVRKRFHLPLKTPQEVKQQDLRALMTEIRDLGGEGDYWLPEQKEKMPEPWPGRIIPWVPAVAEKRFIIRFRELVTAEAGYHD